MGPGQQHRCPASSESRCLHWRRLWSQVGSVCGCQAAFGWDTCYAEVIGRAEEVMEIGNWKNCRREQGSDFFRISQTFLMLYSGPDWIYLAHMYPVLQISSSETRLLFWEAPFRRQESTGTPTWMCHFLVNIFGTPKHAECTYVAAACNCSLGQFTSTKHTIPRAIAHTIFINIHSWLQGYVKTPDLIWLYMSRHAPGLGRTGYAMFHDTCKVHPRTSSCSSDDGTTFYNFCSLTNSEPGLLGSVNCFDGNGGIAYRKGMLYVYNGFSWFVATDHLMTVRREHTILNWRQPEQWCDPCTEVPFCQSLTIFQGA
jgi:hypothetical protein